MEYLLGQSNRGDLLTSLQQSEIGVTLPEMQGEVQEDSSFEDTSGPSTSTQVKWLMFDYLGKQTGFVFSVKSVL